jgi:Uma2 family endonuclease
MKIEFRKWNDKEFERVCSENSDMQFEVDSEGVLIVMPLKGGKDSILNFCLIGEFGKWSEKNNSGQGFSAGTIFALPNGAKRSPDLSWVKNERWEKLTDKEQEGFPPLCPDFVVELRSATDSLTNLKNKMTEYIENGAALGWLIDPFERKVYVYRPNAEIEILDNPETVGGEPLLKKFSLKLNKIWS